MLVKLLITLDQSNCVSSFRLPTQCRVCSTLYSTNGLGLRWRERSGRWKRPSIRLVMWLPEVGYVAPCCFLWCFLTMDWIFDFPWCLYIFPGSYQLFARRTEGPGKSEVGSCSTDKDAGVQFETRKTENVQGSTQRRRTWSGNTGHRWSWLELETFNNLVIPCSIWLL